MPRLSTLPGNACNFTALIRECEAIPDINSEDMMLHYSLFFNTIKSAFVLLQVTVCSAELLSYNINSPQYCGA